jgi:hypothetical protein
MLFIWLAPHCRFSQTRLEAIFVGSLFRELAVSGSLPFKVRLQLGVFFGSGHLLKLNGHVEVFREHFHGCALLTPSLKVPVRAKLGWMLDEKRQAAER